MWAKSQTPKLGNTACDVRNGQNCNEYRITTLLGENLDDSCLDRLPQGVLARHRTPLEGRDARLRFGYAVSCSVAVGSARVRPTAAATSRSRASMTWLYVRKVTLASA